MNKNEILNVIKKSAIIYKENLCNKNLIFITQKNKKVDFFNMLFLPSNFKHLTGYDEVISGRKVTANEFFQNCLNNKISPKDLIQSSQWANEKIEILPQIVKIDKIAKILGTYNEKGIMLQTEKIAGNVNMCMGFIEKEKFYIPNTILKDDIRNITSDRQNILAILKKNMQSEKYNEVTYLKREINIKEICDNNIVDIENLYSENVKIANIINESKK